ncbi:hypothetical protein NQ314_014323 [Rhamnusium bicolor]|uniref:Peptidase S1 domain-containing protein n=1 Tax=Rhamnusium bicolor TaxID=1586634 RepID=A0AAV8X292_9CUCU|nr:hypothetical protein NQ314_014323 [Rhamnusium bicolor]
MFKSIAICLVLSVVVKCAPQAEINRPNFDGRIVGGDDANIEDYPYQLSLLYHGSHMCGASIIGEKWALTAGHCTNKLAAEDLSIRAGSSILQSGGQLVNVTKIYQHPSFNPDTIDYDISLLELAESIILTKSASVISLVDANIKIAPGTETIITGWGKEHESDNFIPNQLQVVEVPLVSNEICAEMYGGWGITDRMICAGYVGEGGKDACQGDSGGPLVVNGKLAGIVSWGYGCADPEFPGVYSNISSMRDFVTEISGI